jgi:glycosyltransferase involved in cell wall biosynthesis
MDGFSAIICCHNGALRLSATLRHLKAQEAANRPWEVLLVDNASTDGSSQLALSFWQHGTAPLRIVSEPRLGLSYARERGLAESRYDFLGFVDDDNWVAADWVSTAYDVLSADSRLGAVGSICDPVCEAPAPEWFQNFQMSFAILTDRDFQRMQQPPDFLNGAGLCVRRLAWEKLVENGFRLQLTDRLGKTLSAGGDTELTLALRLAGWRLQIEQRLRLQHFMPIQRLQWTYLRRLLRSCGASDVSLDAYTEHSLSLGPGARRWLSDCWWYQLGRSLGKIAYQPRNLLAALSSDGEGRKEIIEVEEQFGRALGLLRLRRRYGAFRCEIRDAPWKRPDAIGRALARLPPNTQSRGLNARGRPHPSDDLPR